VELGKILGKIPSSLFLRCTDGRPETNNCWRNLTPMFSGL
jgi:hypothetical protein